MSKKNTGRGQQKTSSTSLIKTGEELPDFQDKDKAKAFDEDARDALLDAKREVDVWQQRIAAVMTTDFYDDPEHGKESDIFKRLRGACARAGMLDHGEKEAHFFNIIADKRFAAAVAQLGQGIVGLNVLPLVNKLIDMALAGNEKCLFKALEIAKVLPTKFDFYINRIDHRNAPGQVNTYNFNLEGKSDRELERICDDLDNVEEAEEVFS